MSSLDDSEKAFIIKVADADCVSKILTGEVFTHGGINIFYNEIKLGDIVVIYLGGDQNVVSWRSGLIGYGVVTKAPYDLGVGSGSQRNFKIDVEPILVLKEAIPPKATKLHKKYQDIFYDSAPYIGANHFPTQAIQKIQSKQVIQAISHLLSQEKKSEININRDFLINGFVEWFKLPENFKTSYAGLVDSRVLKSWDDIFFDGKYFFSGSTDLNKCLESSISKIKAVEARVDWLEFNESTSRGAPKAILGESNYLKYLKNLKYPAPEFIHADKKFNASEILTAFSTVGLNFSERLVHRLVSLLLTKQFVILTGLSGSGKTKIAQAFSYWISECIEEQVLIVPVGADWTNREPLLGYPNALDASKYVMPETGVADLIMRATSDPENPYFLILDEMNLSHVERYFADFLSLMESGEKLRLHSSLDISDVPGSIEMPKNIFVIGTVNIDETTYMFSPKVLDRAGVIEFRVNSEDMDLFLKNPVKPNLDEMAGLGSSMATNFVRIATENSPHYKNQEALNKELLLFFDQLKRVGAEFGYRTAFEISRFAGIISTLADSDYDHDDIVDAAIIQKLLPKLHGSRNQLVPVLEKLAELCLKDGAISNVKGKLKSDLMSGEDPEVKYPLSFEKIHRMHSRAIKDGFTSFAEA